MNTHTNTTINHIHKVMSNIGIETLRTTSTPIQFTNTNKNKTNKKEEKWKKTKQRKIQNTVSKMYSCHVTVTWVLGGDRAREINVAPPDLCFPFNRGSVAVDRTQCPAHPSVTTGQLSQASLRLLLSLNIVLTNTCVGFFFSPVGL